MRFFASLRRFFAADYTEQSFKAVMEYAIKNNILPRVQKMIQTAERKGDVSEAASLKNLAELYEKYANPRSSESNVFGQTGASVVMAVAKQYNMGIADAHDAAQQMAMYFFEKPNWKNVWDKFDVTRGPIPLNRFFGHILKKNAKWFFRDLSRRTHQPLETDDDELSVIQRTPAPQEETEMDKEFLKESFRDLRKYVHRKFKKEWVKEMFDGWLKVALRKGADRVVMKKDVYPAIAEEYDLSEKTMNWMWMDVKRAMVKFFQDEMDMRISDKLKRQLHLSSEGALVYEQFRRKLAAWLLPFSASVRRMAG